jgi:hypothetical protein
MIELQTPKGIAVAMPASLLVEKGGRVDAPTTSRAGVMAMAKTQTGPTVAINIDRRHHALRGWRIKRESAGVLPRLGDQGPCEIPHGPCFC